ncbi:cysteine-rich receptor-like protein kinase 1 [Rutidosis leptorrhynchoides]|uniref:cysteine-rich receptor-like protein kinase 1 n=1 Tax=Rutidosis leptorrhynchoides TaxID=125765 RepID=UPI003A991D10
MENLGSEVTKQGWGSSSVTSPLPQVYAFAQCYENLPPRVCQMCFSQSKSKLPSCLPSSSARIYFDACFVRFDSYEFFGESLDPKYDYVNCTTEISELPDSTIEVEFELKVAIVLENVTNKASKNGGFAVSELKGGMVSVYALAQCWKTVNDEKCERCLNEAGSRLMGCTPGLDGRALFTGCFLRYSTDRFYGDETKKRQNEEVRRGIIIAIAMGALASAFLIFFGAFIGYRRLSRRRKGKLPRNRNLHFKYEILEKATECFSNTRKLGQGGAGSVFKGTLADGRTVAVKKLFFNNHQWVDQFFNEVNLISGIHHPNIVRLLGCSIEGPESLLVYEYVANRSLDQILFVKNTIHILSWQQRFNIIMGTAEGLAYLHGAKIVHRDIKTSNVLLDENLTPKIADFGLVRCVAPDRTHLSTGIAGTLGYMAPEYLVRGKLTEKADVYSFGVLVLEVSTGRKNSVFSQGSSSILHCVWKHYKAKSVTDSIDAGLDGRFEAESARRVLQIGLLCTQASVALRPSMSNVVTMLKDKASHIPSPKQPPFLNASVLSSDDPTGQITTTTTTYNEFALNDQLDHVDNSATRLCHSSKSDQDVGPSYCNTLGFLAPYSGNHYHLSECLTPMNKEELFNLCHASARNVIKRCFGILKLRWNLIIRNEIAFFEDDYNMTSSASEGVLSQVDEAPENINVVDVTHEWAADRLTQEKYTMIGWLLGTNPLCFFTYKRLVI